MVLFSPTLYCISSYATFPVHLNFFILNNHISKLSRQFFSDFHSVHASDPYRAILHLLHFSRFCLSSKSPVCSSVESPSSWRFWPLSIISNDAAYGFEVLHILQSLVSCHRCVQKQMSFGYSHNFRCRILIPTSTIIFSIDSSSSSVLGNNTRSSMHFMMLIFLLPSVKPPITSNASCIYACISKFYTYAYDIYG